ncbi:hypothetical protein WME76_40185 [Sorangium sp. So ce119]|uniref:hypothetical protein n=1 Tax=Sorangium sp. So ce119 TaxID=3133279 RepID=UPI003F633563
MIATRQVGRRRTRLAAVTVVSLALLGAGSVGLCASAGWLPAPEGADAGPLGPLSAFLLPAGEGARFEGRVVQRLDAGSYTYLEVERAEGERRWVVTLSSSRGARSRADEVRVIAMGFAERFASKRLGRSFDGLYFAVVQPL